MNSYKHTIMLVLFLVFCNQFQAQKKEINWISFEQLEDSLAIKPKKVLINFYADWCVYCKKMDEATFKNEEVIAQLNSNFYAVKMNAESKDSVQFDNKLFINKELGKTRKPTHEIPLLFGRKINDSFILPLTIVLDGNFKIKSRHFEYVSPKEMVSVLED